MVVISEGKLLLQLGETKIVLTDYIHSGWLHASDGGNLNAMFEAQGGDFDLFTEESKISPVCEKGGCSVICVATPLKEKNSGEVLGKAVAHTDLYFWQDVPMVSIRNWFETSEYTPVRDMELCRVSAEGTAWITRDGEWKELSGEVYTANGAHLVCRDMREFGEAHPFTTHIALKPCELPEWKREKKEWQGPVITSGTLMVQLERMPGGLALAAITDEKAGVVFDGGIAEPLFKLLLRKLDTNEDLMLTSDNGWDQVREEMTSDGPVYRFERAGVALELAAVTNPKQNRIEWEIDVRIRDGNLSAVRLDPPAARMNAQDDTMLFISLGPGQAIPLNSRSEVHITSPYPSIGVCMEYMAMWSKNRRRGIYCGYHDPLASFKMQLADCHDGICKTEVMIPARGIDEPRNGFHMDGQVVWQIFDGDWYDATLIFKEWVHKYATWFTGVPADQRSDVPKWLLEMPVWFRSDMKADLEWMEKLFACADDMGDIPVGVHMYQWHQIPFDTNYPHYNPAKEMFVQQLPVMQARGLKVMPYINGRLWDTHDRGDYDYQFTSIAKPYATKGRNGEVITEHYASKNTKGEPVELAVMCPSTALWQEKQKEINSWILNDLGADAVYVDQIAAAPPVNCMDPTHAHRKGGGSWWYEHYYNLIDHLNLSKKPEQCYTTESNAEPFTGHIGGMLVWHWSGDHQVPAYPVVYAGYQPMLGRNYGAFKRDDTWAFRIMTAQSLCFGDQLGWCIPEVYLESPYREFFRQLVQLRWQYGEYFYSGTCLRPPKLTGDVGQIQSAQLTSAGVLSAMWKKNADGSRIVVLVNITDEERTVKVFPDEADCFEVTLEPASAIIRVLDK